MAAQSWGIFGDVVQSCNHDSGSWKEASAFWILIPMFCAGGAHRSPVLPLVLLLVSSPGLWGVGPASQDKRISPPSFPLASKDPTPGIHVQIAAEGSLESILGDLRLFSLGSYRAPVGIS